MLVVQEKNVCNISNFIFLVTAQIEVLQIHITLAVQFTANPVSSLLAFISACSRMYSVRNVDIYIQKLGYYRLLVNCNIKKRKKST